MRGTQKHSTEMEELGANLKGVYLLTQCNGKVVFLEVKEKLAHSFWIQ